jgi:hypothetical protein
VITPRTGFIAGAALAAGLALGLAGTALAANPPTRPGYPPMMGGRGMMGGASFAPGATFGPGMMGSFSLEQLKRCDEIHDAMHASASPSISPSPR